MKHLIKGRSNILSVQLHVHSSNVCSLCLIGCLATAGALSFGLYSFKQGERQMSQYMMRARILAQGFTVVALIVGVGLSLSTKVPVKKIE